jgi:hypothetical protein
MIFFLTNFHFLMTVVGNIYKVSRGQKSSDALATPRALRGATAIRITKTKIPPTPRYEKYILQIKRDNPD